MQDSCKRLPCHFLWWGERFHFYDPEETLLSYEKYMRLPRDYSSRGRKNIRTVNQTFVFEQTASRTEEF